MLETILGGLVGGIFRIVPEVLKWLDRKDERKHEIAMTDKQIEFEQVRGAQKMAEMETQAQTEWNTGALEALKSSIESQFRPSGIKWVDALSTIIRPLITIQWVILLYPAVIIAGFYISIQHGTAPLDALVKVFGPDEKALVAAILNFWFLGRVFDKAK